MKTKGYIILVVASMTFLLTGFVNADTTLRVVLSFANPERTAIIERQVSEFESANPGVDVEVESLVWATAFEKLLNMARSGQKLDVVEMQDRWTALYVANKDLVDLDPYLKNWSGAKTLTERTIQFSKQVGGKSYMLPFGYYIRALYYNKKMFKEAGLSGPPRTMPELMESARIITEKLPGKYGYSFRGGPGCFPAWHVAMANHLGTGNWFDAEGNSVFNQPAAIEGIKFWRDMYQKGYAPKDSIRWGFKEVLSGFYSGTCAMLDQDPDAMIDISKYMDENDFAVVPLPVGVDGKAYPLVSFGGWSLFNSSQNKELAWKLLSHLASPENNLEWVKFHGIIPIHKGADKDPYYGKPVMKGFFEELNNPQYKLTPFPGHLPEFGYFYDTLSVETTQEILLNKKSVETVADEWAEYLTNAQKKYMQSSK